MDIKLVTECKSLDVRKKKHQIKYYNGDANHVKDVINDDGSNNKMKLPRNKDGNVV